jgi:hypothetical protein
MKSDAWYLRGGRLMVTARLVRSQFPMFLNRLNNSEARIRRMYQYGCLLVMLILVFATWRRYCNWPVIFDISLWDETVYMNMGRSGYFDFNMFMMYGMRPASATARSIGYEGSPLYGLYYYIVSLFSRDPINLFLVSGLTIQIITLSSILISSWILTRSIAISTLVFGLILCSNFLLLSPRGAYLAVVFILLGSSFATLENRLANRLALTMLVALIVCFIRPEFVLGLYLAGGALLVALIGQTLPQVYRAVSGRIQNRNQGIYRLAAYLFLGGVLCLPWSFPTLQGGGRAMGAFKEWYAVYWVSEHNSLRDPFLDYQWVMQQMFPGATTPIQAALSNPSEWIRFTVHNIMRVIPTMRSMVLVRENAIIAAGLVGLLSVAVWSMYNRTQSIGLSRTLKAVPLVESALYAAAPCIVVVFIQAEPRFVLLLLAALMPCCVAVGRWHPWSKVTDLLIAVLAALAIAVAVRPLPISDQPTLQAIITLRNLDLPIRRMFEVDGGWCFYLNRPCTPVWGTLERSGRVADTTVNKSVDTIMVSNRLLNLLQARHDQSLDGFIQGVGGTDWRRYDIGERLYLLHREPSPSL